MTRKLAHIERIAEINPIEGADLIVQYRVLGWSVVSKKGEFQIGDLVCFFEPDCWMENSLAPFLTKPDKFPKVYNGIQGERLRTIRLKGTLSQGLLLPLSILPCEEVGGIAYEEGADITELLGIQKWEPEPEKIPLNAKGNFPSFIPKTDQLRVQGEMRSIENYLTNNPDATFTIEEKAEGSSTTVFFYNDEFGICSRNLQLKIDDPEAVKSSNFAAPAFELELEEKLKNWYKKVGQSLALQFENIGPQVQGNYYGLPKWELRLFDVFLIDEQRYMTPHEMREIAMIMGLETVPIIATGVSIKGKTVDDFLSHANGPSQIGNIKNLLREGDVYKSESGERFTFKSVSPEYLIRRGY